MKILLLSMVLLTLAGCEVKNRIVTAPSSPDTVVVIVKHCN